MKVLSLSRKARTARIFIILLAAPGALSIGRASAIAQVLDAPVPQTAPSKHQTEDNNQNNQNNQKEQTKRILGIIPNFRAVSADTTLPPQTVKEKFLTATQDSFDYSAIFVPAVLAGASMAANSTPEFGDGAAEYARYFWHAALDQTSRNYMTQFVVPVIARQDSRYYTLGNGTFLKRAGYAFSRTIITRSDSAKEQFNVSEVLGTGAAAALSTTYYPASRQNFSSVGKRWGVGIGVGGLSFVLKEFWPDINYHLFHGSRPDASLVAQPKE
jgi:hypothetical protein